MIKGILFDLNGVLLKNTSKGVVFIEKNTNLLFKLSQKYKLAILSNAPSCYREEIQGAGLTKYFNAIILSEEVGFSKPDIELFEIVLNKIGLRFEEVVFVDDSYDNILVAEKLGLVTIFYDGAGDLQEQLTAKGIVV